MPAHPAPSVRPDEPTQPAAGSRISVDRVIPGIAATVLLTSIALLALVDPGRGTPGRAATSPVS